MKNVSAGKRGILLCPHTPDTGGLLQVKRLMTDMLKAVERIAAACGWDLSELEAEARPMGATNTSYRCRYRGEWYVVRVASSCPDLLAINRQAEAAALKAVSASGCGAPLVYYDISTGTW